MKKILIMGLPNSGKTSLAAELASLLGAVNFNADDIRTNINKDLGFSNEDRIEQAKRMGHLCDIVTKSGNIAIADFICPTPETREAFGKPDLLIYMNTSRDNPYEDTGKIFIPPNNANVIISTLDAKNHAKTIVDAIVPPNAYTTSSKIDSKKPTALFLGRYQPFHEGHKALILEGLSRVGQVCIAVRDTSGIDKGNPFDFDFVKERITDMLAGYMDKIVIVQLPNITNIFYGRDVGYTIEKIELSDELHAISATNIRKEMGI